MSQQNKKKATVGKQLFIKSAVWTFLAIMLMVIGYLGAGYLSGVL